MVAAAIVGGAVIGGVASNMAAGKQADSANRAADMQQAATNFQENQLLDTKQNLQPYMDAAQPALGELKQGTSQGGDFNRPVTAADINANISPDYGFVQQQGELGVKRQEAAQGLYGSGAASKAMGQYDTGLASEYANTAFSNYQNSLAARFQRLQQVAAGGQNAAVGEGGIANTAAGTVASSTNQTGQNIIGAGNANAAGIVGGANAISQPLNTVGTLGLLKNYGISPTSTPTDTQSGTGGGIVNGGISLGSVGGFTNSGSTHGLGLQYDIGGQTTGGQ